MCIALFIPPPPTFSLSIYPLSLYFVRVCVYVCICVITETVHYPYQSRT